MGPSSKIDANSAIRSFLGRASAVLPGLNLVTGSRVIRIWKVASSGLDNTVLINNHPQD